MKPFSEMSIRRQLTLTTLVASGIALLLASLAFMAYDWITFQRSVVRRVNSEAEIIGYNCATAIVFNDPEAARKTLSALQAEPNILSAALYARDGRPFVSYERPGVRSLKLPQTLSADAATARLDAGRLSLARSIVFAGDRVGSLFIVSDLSERIQRMERYALIVAFTSLAALFVAAVAGSFAQRVIARPISSLAAASRAVSERNDLSVRAAPEGTSEIGRLVTTFNRMLSDLQKREDELNAAYKRAAEASQLKDQFLATLSHELRTPLNAIVGWAQMLRTGLDPESQQRAIDTISRNAMVQTQLIADILDMQRIASGKLRLNLASIDPVSAIEAAIDTVRPAAAAKGIELQAVLDPAASPILGDADRIQQIVWNLLSNAVKFSPKGGRVRAGLMKVNSHIEILVEDTGPGLDPEFIPYAFERFRQADSSSTRRHGGLGLGLAIVRDLAELHGGSVAAANRTVGTGAAFTVKLPRMSVSSVSAVAAPAGYPDRRDPTREDEVSLSTAPQLHNVRVLVVEDQVDARELIAAVLAACGADVIAVSSAAEGMAQLLALRPDVLVSDVEMPGEDGYAFLTRVRALPAERGGDIPAAALTAYAGTSDRVRALAAGFQLHIAKPVQPAELAAVVASLANRERRK